jgi:isopentenyl phosphate kinase
MTVLSLDMEQSLREQGLPAVVIPPFCIAQLQDGTILTFNLDIVKQVLSRDCVLITHGDVCIDTSRGASILSGDSIVTYLAQNLAPHYVIIGTDVDGLFDADPRANTQAQLIPLINRSNRSKILESTGPSLSTDVTGGMTKKVTELLALKNIKSKIIILNLCVPKRLEHALADRSIRCTTVIPD